VLNARLFALPVTNDNANLASAELQKPPIDQDPQLLNTPRYNALMNNSYGTSTTGSR
jgi:hypothetical protein